MAYFSMLLASILLLLLLLHGCIAMGTLPQTKCQAIHDHLIATKPDIYIPSEAGSVEFWNPNLDRFQCAGVAVLRYTMQPNGLVVPFYVNVPQVAYIIQGKGVFQLMTSGCSEISNDEKNECQEIQHFQKGDMMAFREGETIWGYNTGNETVIVIAVNPITDTGRARVFTLGGSHNILQGFSSKFIREAFNVNDELAMKLKSMKDLRGSITYVTSSGLHLSSSPTTQPCRRQDQHDRKGLPNFTDESLCNINTRLIKISDPSKADIFIPEVGHMKTIDARQLPILGSIQLSVSYSFLLKDVMRLPHWENSYIIIYVVKGKGEIQVVDENGKNVFNDIVKEGQLLIVPQNFVLAKQTKNEIFEYVTFKTNANPITTHLSGRNSVIYDLPLEVLTNAFIVNEKEAKRMKFGMKETYLTKV